MGRYSTTLQLRSAHRVVVSIASSTQRPLPYPILRTAPSPPFPDLSPCQGPPLGLATKADCISLLEYQLAEQSILRFGMRRLSPVPNCGDACSATCIELVV